MGTKMFGIWVSLSVLVAVPSFGVVKFVTSTTDLAWVANELGGDGVEVKSLLRGHENPHFVDAVPEFIRYVSEADIVCTVGLDLEVGWMPKVLSRSTNAQVQPGGKGFCETGPAVHVLDKPAGAVDRSMGDVHPSGNPHFWLSPTHMAQAAKKMSEALIGVDPAKAARYRESLKRIEKKLAEIHVQNQNRLKMELNGKKPSVLEYHKEFSYFFSAYGLESFGSIEEKPGVPPSAGRLAEVAISAKAAGVQLVIASDTVPKSYLERFKELSGIPYVTVPMSLQPSQGVDSYDKLQTKLIDAVIKYAKAG